MAYTAEELKNVQGAYDIYGNGILHPDVVAQLFEAAIAKAAADEAVPAGPVEAAGIPAATKRPRSKQAE